MAAPLYMAAPLHMAAPMHMWTAHEPLEEGEAEAEALELTAEERERLRWELGWELHKYAREQQRVEFKALLDGGGADIGATGVFADIEWRDEGGTTALFWACVHGDAEVAQTLLDAGADPNGVDADSWTPISVATRYGHDNCVLALLRAGADPSVPVSDGDTALDKAVFWDHAECERLLREHGAVALKPVVVVPRPTKVVVV